MCSKLDARLTSPYGLESFQLGKADLHSLDFTFNRFCMKLFKTGSNDIVKDCQNYFAIDLPSCDFKKRQDKLRISSLSLSLSSSTLSRQLECFVTPE